jgi:hypothetical protein
VWADLIKSTIIAALNHPHESAPGGGDIDQLRILPPRLCWQKYGRLTLHRVQSLETRPGLYCEAAPGEIIFQS